MSAAPMPTEMQCLAARLHQGAQALARDAALLPQLFAALTALAAGYKPDVTSEENAAALAAMMLELARTLEFDARRLQMLADDHADDARHLYGIAMEVVDACRLARAMAAAPTPGNLASLCEDFLGEIQQQLAAQFPGETIPGG